MLRTATRLLGRGVGVSSSGWSVARCCRPRRRGWRRGRTAVGPATGPCPPCEVLAVRRSVTSEGVVPPPSGVADRAHHRSRLDPQLQSDRGRPCRTALEAISSTASRKSSTRSSCLASERRVLTGLPLGRDRGHRLMCGSCGSVLAWDRCPLQPPAPVPRCSCTGRWSSAPAVVERCGRPVLRRHSRPWTEGRCGRTGQCCARMAMRATSSSAPVRGSRVIRSSHSSSRLTPDDRASTSISRCSPWSRSRLPCAPAACSMSPSV